MKKISRIEISIRNTALADGPAPLIGVVELKPPFKLPMTLQFPMIRRRSSPTRCSIRFRSA